MGSPCVPLMRIINCFRRIVAHLSGLDDKSLRNIDVAQVLRKFSVLSHHGAGL